MSILDVPGISKAQLEARVTGITDEVVEARDMAQAFAIDSLGSVIESHAIVLQAPLDAKATVDVLRDDLNTKGTEVIAKALINENAIVNLQKAVRKTDSTIRVKSYFDDWLISTFGPYGGGNFAWNPNKLKSEHNGGTIISPSVVWNGSLATHENFLNGVGETDPNGSGCFVSLEEKLSIWRFGARKFLNDGQLATTDSTYAVQKAIYAAKRSTLTATHSISQIVAVGCENGETLIDKQLVFPEGIVLDGGNSLTSRLCFGWGIATKIIGYGRVYDTLMAKPLGTTLTKNWGLKNLTLAPYYVASGPSACTYVDYLFDIEPILHNVRIIMHKGAVLGGQLNATAVHFKKCIDPSFIDVTFDGGLNHLDASDATYGWGMRTARMSHLYSYNAKSHGLHTGNSSDDNVVQFDEIQMTEQVGDNRGVYIEGTGKNNTVTFTGIGSKMRYGAIIEGSNNTVVGKSIGSVLGVDVRGVDNTVNMTLSGGADWSDSGEGSTLTLPGFTKVAGLSTGSKNIGKITAATTWIDVAEITFTTGAGRAVVLTGAVAAQIEGVGRDCYESTWMVGQTTVGVTTATERATPFNPLSSLKLRVVSSATNKAKLQVQIATGTGTLTDVEISYTMRADRFVRIKSL